MTAYSLDVTDVLQTIWDTLAERVLPALDDDQARSELSATLEMLDNITGRLDWKPSVVDSAAERSARLAMELGSGPDEVHGPRDAVDDLRRSRAAAAQALSHAYDDPDRARAIADTVAGFTVRELRDEISVGLRHSLPS